MVKLVRNGERTLFGGDDPAVDPIGNTAFHQGEFVILFAHRPFATEIFTILGDTESLSRWRYCIDHNRIQL